MDTSGVTRFEVIHHTGREMVLYDVEVDLELQDDGRTLKVFLTDRAPVLRASDLHIETVTSGLTRSSWVKITHMPTGKSAWSSADSELVAKSAALAELRNLEEEE